MLAETVLVVSLITLACAIFVATLLYGSAPPRGTKR